LSASISTSLNEDAKALKITKTELPSINVVNYFTLNVLHNRLDHGKIMYSGMRNRGSVDGILSLLWAGCEVF